MINKNLLEQLCVIHIQRYSALINRGLAGARGIRIDECRDYLNIWLSISEKAGVNLTKEEGYELNAALADAGLNAQGEPLDGR